MNSTCPACGGNTLDIDVKCPHCGAPLASTGAHRMVGSVVLGQYELVDVLGQGGMSVVYKGRHQLTEQEVALKILPPELAAHAQVKSRFLEEAKALAQLDHPNIVHLYNFGQENGCFVLAMQYVRGKTWERMILENKRLPWAVSARITVDVLRALEYAHTRGIVHRDMKPSNVLVRDDDQIATVMDFGIAKMTNSTRLTATGQTMGTVRYMSPEQVRGQEVDLRTDIYSLGATLYESLTGDTPFDGDTHFEIMTKHLTEVPRPPSLLGVELPVELEQALLRSLAKKPEQRFDSAREFRTMLEQVLRTSDAGLAQTMRLARDSVGATSFDGGQKSTATAPLARGLSTSAGVSSVDGDPDDARSGVVSSRRWLVVALAATGVVVGTAVTLWATRDQPGARPKVAVKPSRGAPYTPAGMKWTSEAGQGEVRVFAAGQIPAAAVLSEYQKALVAVQAVVDAAEPGTSRLIPGEINVIVVPPALLCAPSTYSETSLSGTVSAEPVPDDCARVGAWYRIAERTLVIADDPAKLSTAMKVGICFRFMFDSDHRQVEDVLRRHKDTLVPAAK
jgi:serine/threonine-protein kinase